MAVTVNQGYGLPDSANYVSQEFPAIGQVIVAIDVDIKSLMDSVAALPTVASSWEMSAITGLTTALDAKAAVNHSHNVDDLTGISGVASAQDGMLMVKSGTGLLPMTVTAAISVSVNTLINNFDRTWASISGKPSTLADFGLDDDYQAMLTARDATFDARDETIIYKDVVLNALYQDLSAIAQTKAITPVDLFVGSVGDDSDPTWPKRCQHTSWLAADGEFPVLFGLIAEASVLHLYNCADPATPLYKSFDFTGFTITSIAMSQGQIVVGTTTGLVVLDFAGDSLDVEIAYDDSTSPAIAHNSVTGVRMTTLPTAPVNPATGLQVPTLFATSGGGVSVVKEDGTVSNSNASAAACSLSISEQNRISWRKTSVGIGFYVADYPDWLTDGFSISTYDATTTPTLNGAGTPVGYSTVDYSGDIACVAVKENGIALLKEDFSDRTKSMVCQVTTNHNTGWTFGDLKFMGLCSSEDTDLVGGELVENGTFDADTTGWVGSSAIISADTGRLKVLVDGASSGVAYQAMAVTDGEHYILQFDKEDGDNTGWGVYQESTGTWLIGPNSNAVDGSYKFDLTANSSAIVFRFYGFGDGLHVFFDNIKLGLAEPDRSVNNNGLIVNGTVPKAYINESDTVEYGPFSSTDFLEQPYNADLDVGTGDLFIGFIVRTTGIGSSERYCAREVTGGGRAFRIQSNSGTGILSAILGTTTLTSSYMIADSAYHYVGIARRDGVGYLHVDGELVFSVAAADDLTLADAVLRVGIDPQTQGPADLSTISLFQISATCPSNVQIKEIASAALNRIKPSQQSLIDGSSDAVLDIAYDKSTKLRHVLTSDGESIFQGGIRVGYNAGSWAKIAAHGELVMKG